MVADKVEVVSKSFKEGSEAALWECDGSTEFELSDAKKESRGTDVILHVNADSEEFLDEWRLKGILEKYCKFLPIEIKFGTKDESVEDGEDNPDGDREAKKKYKKHDIPKILIGDTHV